MTIDCDGKCSNCNGTQLPNIKDNHEVSIVYSYAYKTDCSGDRYIKAEEVKYLLECERNKAIDDFVKSLQKLIEKELSNSMLMLECKKCGIWKNYNIEHIAEQLKAGELNEQSI